MKSKPITYPEWSEVIHKHKYRYMWMKVDRGIGALIGMCIICSEKIYNNTVFIEYSGKIQHYNPYSSYIEFALSENAITVSATYNEYGEDGYSYLKKYNKQIQEIIL